MTFKSYVETQFDTKLKILRIDGGGEYDNTKFHQFLSSHGILHQLSCVRRQSICFITIINVYLYILHQIRPSSMSLQMSQTNIIPTNLTNNYIKGPIKNPIVKSPTCIVPSLKEEGCST